MSERYTFCYYCGELEITKEKLRKVGDTHKPINVCCDCLERYKGDYE
jgi:hypothetical protein